MVGVHGRQRVTGDPKNLQRGTCVARPLAATLEGVETLPQRRLSHVPTLLPSLVSALQLGVRIAGPISLESERRALVSLRSALQGQALPQALRERVHLRERLQAGVQPPFPPSVGK